MHTVFTPVKQGSSGATCLGCGGNVGRTVGVESWSLPARWDLAWEKYHPNVCSLPLVASQCDANGISTGLGSHIAAHASRDAAESVFPVIVPPGAVPAQVLAAHGVADIPALDVTTVNAMWCWGHVG
jgi:predicted ATP-grasp superfamily ATP-dependent carboligase